MLIYAYTKDHKWKLTNESYELAYLIVESFGEVSAGLRAEIWWARSGGEKLIGKRNERVEWKEGIWLLGEKFWKELAKIRELIQPDFFISY